MVKELNSKQLNKSWGDKNSYNRQTNGPFGLKEKRRGVE